jgi:hypothetical protein
MTRRMTFILVMVALLLFCLKLSLSAQKSPQEEIALYDYSLDLERIEAKMDKLSSTLDKTNNDIKADIKTIFKKLDDILNNQERILKELEIVKIRASHR